MSARFCKGCGIHLDRIGNTRRIKADNLASNMKENGMYTHESENGYEEKFPHIIISPQHSEEKGEEKLVKQFTYLGRYLGTLFVSFLSITCNLP